MAPFWPLVGVGGPWATCLCCRPAESWRSEVLMGWTGVTLVQILGSGLPQDIGEAELFFKGLSGGQAALLGQLVSLLLTVAGWWRRDPERDRAVVSLGAAPAVSAADCPGGLGRRAQGCWGGLSNLPASLGWQPAAGHHHHSQRLHPAFFSIGTGIGCILATPTSGPTLPAAAPGLHHRRP